MLFFHNQLPPSCHCLCPIMRRYLTTREHKWFGTPRKGKRKKNLGKQFPVTYILSSQFRATVINAQPALPQRGLSVQSHTRKDHACLQTGSIPLTNQSSLLNVNGDSEVNVRNTTSVSVDNEVGLCGSPVVVVVEASEMDWCLQKLTADLCLLWSRFSLSARPPLCTHR